MPDESDEAIAPEHPTDPVPEPEHHTEVDAAPHDEQIDNAHRLDDLQASITHLHTSFTRLEGLVTEAIQVHAERESRPTDTVDLDPAAAPAPEPEPEPELERKRKRYGRKR